MRCVYCLGCSSIVMYFCNIYRAFTQKKSAHHACPFLSKRPPAFSARSRAAHRSNPFTLPCRARVDVCNASPGLRVPQPNHVVARTWNVDDRAHRVGGQGGVGQVREQPKLLVRPPKVRLYAVFTRMYVNWRQCQTRTVIPPTPQEVGHRSTPSVLNQLPPPKSRGGESRVSTMTEQRAFPSANFVVVVTKFVRSVLVSIAPGSATR